MGCCIRTGTHLCLDLPAIIWKQIVGEPLDITDLNEIDKFVVGTIDFVISTQCKESEFGTTFPETFSTLLSDESVKELIPGGNKITLTFDQRFEYAELVLKARLSENYLQCQAIRKGIAQIVPEALLNILTHQEINAIVCGTKTLDLEMLKRHTTYGAGLTENTERVVFFWEVLNELSKDDQMKFIKFCWGQERLPANDEEYERKNVRFMIKESLKKRQNENQALPKADTCFFNVELPKYTTKDALRQKLLTALHMDFLSMNADPHEGQDNDPRQRHGSDEE